MGAQFVTSQRGGKPHVRSHHFAKLNAAIIGMGTYVMTGLGDDELEAHMATANTLHAGSGLLVAQGREIIFDEDGWDWTVQTGTQGQKRIDVCCVKYSKTRDGVEDIEPATLRGEPTTGEPVAPTVPACDLTTGAATEGLVPVFQVELDGTVPGRPVPLFRRMESAQAARDRIDAEAAKVRPVALGGTGASEQRQACANLGAVAGARPALISDVTIGALSRAQPGTYLVAPEAAGSPCPGRYGNMLLVPTAPDGYTPRVLAIAAFDNGAMRIGYRGDWDDGFAWRSVDNYLGAMDGVLDVARGGTGATDAAGACANLDVVKGFRAMIHDVSWDALYGLAPGSYIIENYAKGSPMTGSYGNLFVSLGNGRAGRVTALATFDNGAAFAAYGSSAALWTRLDNGMFNDGIAEHGWSGSFEYWKYHSGFARLIWKYGASTGFNAYGSGYMYASGRFAFPFPLLGLVGAVGSNNMGTNVLNAYPIDITSESFAFYIGALSPTHSQWQVCFEFTGRWK